jgi:hypothetical protein
VNREEECPLTYRESEPLGRAATTEESKLRDSAVQLRWGRLGKRSPPKFFSTFFMYSPFLLDKVDIYIYNSSIVKFFLE